MTAAPQPIGRNRPSTPTASAIAETISATRASCDAWRDSFSKSEMT
jgi:hypothetical protein